MINNHSSRPLIGTHVSTAGGLAKAIDRAEAIGAEAIQIFGVSPRSWSAPLPSAEAIAAYRKRLAASSVRAVYLHAPYLINLASPDPRLRNISTHNLIAHFKITEAIGAAGLIFHLGSGKEMPMVDALAVSIEAMRKAVQDVPGRAHLIMENSAGGGQKIGATMEDLQILYRGVDSRRLKICFDTAHAFEAGLVMDYAPDNIDQLCRELDRTVGLQNVVVVHANDSRTAASSHHDQHENIGQGHIGLAGFQNLARESKFCKMPWLLEVPGFDGEGPDAKNIKILKECFD
ncbi:MAG: deoxyribonuclease IV [Candidatus Liptonbacteria bacterium]|nr:deoxyribonuclease IV [Candidatus Liptonbacteria bacterium]